MDTNVENDIPVVEAGVENDDFFDDINEEVISEQELSNSDEGMEEQESTPNEPEQEISEKEEEIDFKPFLEYLSKNVKYNKESVNVENIDEVINSFQKGLNYDKLQDKLSSLQNSKAETYINKKAKELGLTVDEYMDQVEKYEKEQELAREEERMQEMIDNGVPEDIAREVVATAQLRKTLEAERNELKAEREKAEAEKTKNKEYEEFLKAYPDVDAESIPKEVFEAAQSSSLKQAYTEWKMHELEKKLAIMQKNEENSKSSVGGITEHDGKSNNNSQDLFLQGFES